MILSGIAHAAFFVLVISFNYDLSINQLNLNIMSFKAFLISNRSLGDDEEVFSQVDLRVIKLNTFNK